MSVVIIAFEAESKFLGCDFEIFGNISIILSTFSFSPITPVEETRIWLFLHLKYFEAAATYLSIALTPFLPVWAFAFPALIINNLQNPLLFFLSHIIGAEGVEVFEYTADKGVNSLKTTNNKSSNFFWIQHEKYKNQDILI